MRNLIALLLLLSSLFCAVDAQTSAVPAGDGSAGNPYQIDSLPNLYWLSTTVSAWNSNFIQLADIDASSTSSWNYAQGWSPIGDTSTLFTGTYNGNGKHIAKLFINRPTTNIVGLFGEVSGTGSIKKLFLDSVNVAGQDGTGALWE